MPDKKISFHFRPNIKKETGTYTITKDENGKSRRYMEGITSGIKKDLHGDRMTPECIKSFMDQANSGLILLYPDIHGIKQSEDIGILKEAYIQPDGDWFTSFRLYDEDDGIGPVKLEKIDDTWKQSNGLPPYPKSLQKGFSIEGIMPEQTGFSFSQKGERLLNNVILDGVCLVPRPAYQDGIANAVFKALDETPPWVKDKIKKSIDSKLSSFLENKDLKNQYYQKKVDIDSAFEEMIDDIMQDPKGIKTERLNSLFDEYKQLMVDLIINSESIFGIEDSNSKEGSNVEFEKLFLAYEKNNKKIISILKSAKN